MKNAPATRPLCFYCDALIRRSRGLVRDPHTLKASKGPRRFQGYAYINGPDRAPAFCKLSCALDFAHVLVRAGRRVGPNAGMNPRTGGLRDGIADRNDAREIVGREGGTFGSAVRP